MSLDRGAIRRYLAEKLLKSISDGALAKPNSVTIFGNSVPLRGSLCAAIRVLDGHQLQPGSNSPEIPGVTRYDSLSGPTSTNDDVGIDDIRRRSSCQQEADCGRVRSV